MGGKPSKIKMPTIVCPKDYNSEDFQKILTLYDRLDRNGNFGLEDCELEEISALHIKNNIRNTDVAIEDNGVKIAVEKKSFLYLVGTTLDFSGGLNGKGFVFSNPNADRTCGCGESFSL